MVTILLAASGIALLRSKLLVDFSEEAFGFKVKTNLPGISSGNGWLSKPSTVLITKFTSSELDQNETG
jgi:hypothetical protein